MIRCVDEGEGRRGSDDEVTHKVLPSFGSHDGGEILRAGIIHYGEYVCTCCNEFVCKRSPKASCGQAYIGVLPKGLQGN